MIHAGWNLNRAETGVDYSLSVELSGTFEDCFYGCACASGTSYQPNGTCLPGTQPPEESIWTGMHACKVLTVLVSESSFCIMTHFYRLPLL